jgi:hypothetical protein
MQPVTWHWENGCLGCLAPPPATWDDRVHDRWRSPTLGGNPHRGCRSLVGDGRGRTNVGGATVGLGILGPRDGVPGGNHTDGGGGLFAVKDGAIPEAPKFAA